MKNPWIQPIINAVVISLIGAGGLWFLRSQQPPPRAVAIAESPRAVTAPPVAAGAAPEVEAPAPMPAHAGPEGASIAAPAVAPTVTPPPPPPTPEPSSPTVTTQAAPSPPAAVAAPAPGPTAGGVTAGSAVLRGVVHFKAPPPRRALIRMDADPKCAAMHADEPPLSEEVVVNDNGTLRNVFVYLKQAPSGQTYAAPRAPVVLDQIGCAYQPRVLGVQVRQPLLIRNSDDTLHNVHALARNNREFNIGQPNRGMESIRVFTTPEVMIRFKCDVHPWMSAYVGVLDHPFFAVTGADGTFSISDVPAGTHTLVAWHEKLGVREQTVTVSGGEPVEIPFTFGE